MRVVAQNLPPELTLVEKVLLLQLLKIFHAFKFVAKVSIGHLVCTSCGGFVVIS